MTFRRLLLTTGLSALMGALAFAQEPPKSLPPVPIPGQPKEMDKGKDKGKDKDKGKTDPKEPVGGKPADEPPPPPIRPEVPGDIVDPVYKGSYIHGTSTVYGGVTYEGPLPNGLFRRPNYHFGGFVAPAPFWPALSLPDYYHPAWGIHSQYFGYTPYTFGLWETSPRPSPLAGGAIYPDITIKPGEMLPSPSSTEKGPMPPPGTAPKPPGLGTVPGQPIPTAPQGTVPGLPAVRRR